MRMALDRGVHWRSGTTYLRQTSPAQPPDKRHDANSLTTLGHGEV